MQHQPKINRTPEHSPRPAARSTARPAACPTSPSRRLPTRSRWFTALLTTALLAVTAVGTTHAQMYDYSIIGQSTNDFWDGTGDSEFNILTASTGFQLGRMQEVGLGTEWAVTILLPISLTFDGEDETRTADLDDADFGAGLGFRYGLGYGIPLGRLLVTPGIAYHAMYIRYSFSFPGGASEYYELTHGPAAVAQAAFQITDRFHLHGGIMFAFSPFHAGGMSRSGSDEDMRFGLATRGWLGVRLPVSLMRGRF